MNKEKVLEFFWSSVTTFLAAFFLTAAPMIGGAPLDTAFILSIIMVAGRAGFKAVVQWAMSGKAGELLGAKGRV